MSSVLSGVMMNNERPELGRRQLREADTAEFMLSTTTLTKQRANQTVKKKPRNLVSRQHLKNK